MRQCNLYEAKTTCLNLCRRLSMARTFSSHVRASRRCGWSPSAKICRVPAAGQFGNFADVLDAAFSAEVDAEVASLMAGAHKQQRLLMARLLLDTHVVLWWFPLTLAWPKLIET